MARGRVHNRVIWKRLELIWSDRLFAAFRSTAQAGISERDWE